MRHQRSTDCTCSFFFFFGTLSFGVQGLSSQRQGSMAAGQFPVVVRHGPQADGRGILGLTGASQDLPLAAGTSEPQMGRGDPGRFISSLPALGECPCLFFKFAPRHQAKPDDPEETSRGPLSPSTRLAEAGSVCVCGGGISSEHREGPLGVARGPTVCGLRGCWGADRGEEGKSSHFPRALLNTVLSVCLSPSLP